MERSASVLIVLAGTAMPRKGRLETTGPQGAAPGAAGHAATATVSVAGGLTE
jgi:hypothetical protein